MDKQLNAFVKSTGIEGIFTIITFITMMTGLLLEFLDWPVLWINGLYFIAYVTGGWFGLKGGIEALLERTIDVDLLMVLAALGAAYIGAPFEGAMLLFLFSLSNVLQDYAMDRTRNAIRALMQLRPNQALIRRDGRELTLPIEAVQIDERFIVKPGDRIPLDGTIVSGESTVDQASITGESMPVAKRVDDVVLAGTINKSGSFEAKVTKLAHDSTLAKMIKLVEEAQDNKAQTQRFLDTAEQYYATGVIAFTLIAILLPLYGWGEDFQTAFYRAMTIMVAASPCALIISTPASILSAIGAGARRGVLFKGGVYVEQAADISVVAFDKTGTLTEGKPRVTDVQLLPSAEWSGSVDDLLSLAATVQTKSEHVLGKAMVSAAKERQLELSETLAFQATAGRGVEGQIDGDTIRIGNLGYFEEFTCVGLEAAREVVTQHQKAGQTSVVVAKIDDNRANILGVIAFADRIRPNAAAVVAELKALGVQKVVMLTGDNERVAQAVADKIGVDAYYADLLPEDKVRLAKELEAEHGKLAMTGDGVNDAPALATASIGIAMGAAGTDVALETADVVLLSDELDNLPYLIDLSRQTRRTLFANLGFSLAMIVLMIGAILTVGLSLPLAVIGHEGGTVLVSLNGLRLLLFKRKHIDSQNSQPPAPKPTSPPKPRLSESPS